MKSLAHLYVNASKLAPGEEWKDTSPGWKIVLLNQGFFYWIGRADVRELQPGDVLVVGPTADGVLRASQVTTGTLHFFYFRPEHLVGIISLSERLSLDTFGKRSEIRIIPARDEIAQQYGALINNSARQRSFFYRCHILRLVALIFGDTLPNAFPPKTGVTTTLLRFEEIISRIPDADLINYSSEKLAELCGCSLRHFRRMFRRQFKTSIRAKQTELRLEKARQLLAETEDKVLNIARETGYRHLGLFNAMFKKRFGMTPTEWRWLHSRAHAEKQRRSC